METSTDPVPTTAHPSNAAAAVAGLPNTGEDLTRGLLWSALLLVAGAGAVLLSRRTGSVSRGRHS